MPKVLIVAGSQSDLGDLTEMIEIFKQSGVEYIVSIVSCHRNLRELAVEFNKKYFEDNNIKVIVAIANSVANLPAIIAGYTKKFSVCVIGVGKDNGNLKGLDNLLSVNSIPKGVPLLNSGIGEIGVYNAGLAAVKIISLLDEQVRDSFIEFLHKNQKKPEFDIKL
ncbi:AIR carboxylase family protein [Patescibacteria group bacterium]